MNPTGVTRQYAQLTPEERFRLILAASGRGDEAERDRLMRAGGRISLSVPDHAPYAESFEEFALLTFIELADEVARYDEAFHRADDAYEPFDEEERPNSDVQGGAVGDTAERAPTKSRRSKRPTAERLLDLALAAGYVLRAKADGWKLFCDRMNVPPYLLWEGLPGFDRLKRTLELTEKAAFTAEGFLRWMNTVRPAGRGELTRVPLTAEGLADALGAMFRDRVKYHAGDLGRGASSATH